MRQIRENLFMQCADSGHPVPDGFDTCHCGERTPEVAQLRSALEASEARVRELEEALEKIVLNADMPAGETWEESFTEVAEVARAALSSPSGVGGQGGWRMGPSARKPPHRKDRHRRVSRWLRQTKRGGFDAPDDEKGDCVPACIASILCLPLEAIPNCHGEGWWDRLQAGCAAHGYCLACLDMKLAPPPCFWIAAVPTLNIPPAADGKPQWHSVVAQGYELVWDPSIGERRYDEHLWAAAWNGDEVWEGWVLAPLDVCARPDQAEPTADKPCPEPKVEG